MVWRRTLFASNRASKSPRRPKVHNASCELVCCVVCTKKKSTSKRIIVGIRMHLDSPSKWQEALGARNHGCTVTKAPCSCMVYTWALRGFPYHDFRAYVYTIKLLGTFGSVLFKLPSWCTWMLHQPSLLHSKGVSGF